MNTTLNTPRLASRKILPFHGTLEGMNQAFSGYEVQEALFEASWLPQKPLAGDSKNAPKRHMNRAQALTMPSIEVNPLCVQSLIVLDVDECDVKGLATLCGLPEESWAVRNLDKAGTGHIGYALTAPVCLTDAARRKPVNLLARVEVGLRDVLGGDIAYTGRFMKNPVTPPPFHETLWGEEDYNPFNTYGLKELAAALDSLKALPAWNDPAPRKSSGVGRNVDIFDRTRSWAYRAIKRYWSEGIDIWGEVVHAKASYINLDLEREGREPLPAQEIKHLSRSITKWVWNHFNEEKFIEIQRNRINKRWGNSRAENLANLNFEPTKRQEFIAQNRLRELLTGEEK